MTVAAVECVAWGLVGGLGWSLRGLMVGVDSPAGIERTRFAVALLAIAAANTLALLGFLLSRMTWGWWVLFAVQVVDFGFATFQLATRDLGWVVFMAPAVLTATLLFLGRRPAA